MIAETRQELVSMLSAVDVPVHNMMPEEFEAPGIIVYAPSDGVYITGGQFRGCYEIAYDVIIAVANEDDQNQEILNVDNLIEQVLEKTMSWGLRGVDAVGLINIQGVQYPGTAVHIAIQREL